MMLYSLNQQSKAMVLDRSFVIVVVWKLEMILIFWGILGGCKIGTYPQVIHRCKIDTAFFKEYTRDIVVLCFVSSAGEDGYQRLAARAQVLDTEHNLFIT